MTKREEIYDDFLGVTELFEHYSHYTEHSGDHKVELGFPIVDEVLRGLCDAELMTLVMGTGEGKSVFGQNVGLRYAKTSDRLAVFLSLEMTSVNIAERTAQIELGMTGYEVERAFTNKDKETIRKCFDLKDILNNFITIVKRIEITDLPLYIREIEEFTGKKVGFLIVDYVALFRNKEFMINDFAKITDNMIKLKEYAKEFGVPVLNLSQTSRVNAKGELDIYSGFGSGEVEKSSDFLLTMEPLSDGMLQDIGISRGRCDDYELTERKRLLMLTIHKNRRGEKGRAVIVFDKRNLRMRQLEKGELVPQSQDIIQTDIWDEK